MYPCDRDVHLVGHAIVSVDSPDWEESRKKKDHPIFHGELVSPEYLLLPADFLSEQA